MESDQSNTGFMHHKPHVTLIIDGFNSVATRHLDRTYSGGVPVRIEAKANQILTSTNGGQ